MLFKTSPNALAKIIIRRNLNEAISLLPNRFILQMYQMLGWMCPTAVVVKCVNITWFILPAFTLCQEKFLKFIVVIRFHIYRWEMRVEIFLLDRCIINILVPMKFSFPNLSLSCLNYWIIFFWKELCLKMTNSHLFKLKHNSVACLFLQERHFCSLSAPYPHNIIVSQWLPSYIQYVMAHALLSSLSWVTLLQKANPVWVN